MNYPSAQTKRIVVVEDDPSIVMGLEMNLTAEGFEVVTADDGEAGLECIREGCDLAILDLMLPNLNGFEVLKILRSEGDRTPVIVLSARTSELDKVTGLDLGAEDYVTKPFSLSELMARIRVVLRRGAERVDERWGFGDVSVDPAIRAVTRSGEAIDLTRTEFAVLGTLFEAKGRVLARDQIFDRVWGRDFAGTLRTVDNFIAQLRAKLEEDPASPKHILTVRGVGYRLER